MNEILSFDSRLRLLISLRDYLFSGRVRFCYLQLATSVFVTTEKTVVHDCHEKLEARRQKEICFYTCFLFIAFESYVWCTLSLDIVANE